jgi:hypothetical protein
MFLLSGIEWLYSSELLIRTCVEIDFHWTAMTLLSHVNQLSKSHRPLVWSLPTVMWTKPSMIDSHSEPIQQLETVIWVVSR